MVLVQNWQFFQFFFFRQYRPGKCLLRYSRTKKCLSRLKEKKFKKSKNCHFSKGVNSQFWSKNGHFYNFFFKAIQTREMSFTIFQNDKMLKPRPEKCLLRYVRTNKMPFQAIKTRSLKTRKIDIFLRGLSYGFGPKLAIFPIFFFQAIQTRKMSFTIVQNEKMPLQATKRRS